MEKINFLKTVYLNDSEEHEANDFFDNLTDEQRTDIFASFGQYTLPYSFAFADIYYYHLFRIHKNGEWNDTNLELLAKSYLFKNWTVYGQSFYMIVHPKSPFINRELLKEKLFPFIKEKFVGQTGSLVFTNPKGKSIKFEIPIYQLAELEFTIKEAYREQLQIINAAHTYYEKEIGRLFEDTYKITPQLDGFVEWLVKYRQIDRLNIKVEETENNENYIKANFTFDFRPLLKLKKETLKHDLINYCKYVRDEYNKDVEDDRTGKKWTPDPLKARQILNRFDTYLDNLAKIQAGKQNPNSLDKIIKDAIDEMRCDKSIEIEEKQLILI